MPAKDEDNKNNPSRAPDAAFKVSTVASDLSQRAGSWILPSPTLEISSSDDSSSDSLSSGEGSDDNYQDELMDAVEAGSNSEFSKSTSSEATPQHSQLSTIASIAAYAYLGAVCRVYLGRLSALCEGDDCVTSYDSALFVDLPANVLGCFFMGLAVNRSNAVGFTTGFCGSLTTFASWNMQMVTLLERGLYELAVAGYLLGTMCAMGAYMIGLSVAPESSASPFAREPSPWAHIFSPSLLSLILLIVFASMFVTTLEQQDETNHVLYRNLIAMAVSAPAGALARWKLSHRLSRGTLVANLVASAWVAGVVGWSTHDSKWMFVTAGLGGCLSTVSTWIKEIHNLSNRSGVLYGLVTLVSGAALASAIYIPLERM